MKPLLNCGLSIARVNFICRLGLCLLPIAILPGTALANDREADGHKWDDALNKLREAQATQSKERFLEAVSDLIPLAQSGEPSNGVLLKNGYVGAQVDPGFVPNLAIGYAYFQAARLTDAPAERHSYYKSAFYYLSWNRGHDRSRAYDTVLVHKMWVASAIGMKDDLSFYKTWMPEFERIAKEGDGASRAADWVKDIGYAGRVFGNDSNGLSERLTTVRRNEIESALQKLLQRPSLEISDVDRLALTRGGATKTLHLKVNSLLPVGVVVDGAQIEGDHTDILGDAEITLVVPGEGERTLQVHLILQQTEQNLYKAIGHPEWAQIETPPMVASSIGDPRIEAPAGVLTTRTAVFDPGQSLKIRNFQPKTDRLFAQIDGREQEITPSGERFDTIGKLRVGVNRINQIHFLLRRNQREVPILNPDIVVDSDTVSEASYHVLAESKQNRTGQVAVSVKDYAAFAGVSIDGIFYPVTAANTRILPTSDPEQKQYVMLLPRLINSANPPGIQVLTGVGDRKHRATAEVSDQMDVGDVEDLIRRLPEGLQLLARSDYAAASTYYMKNPGLSETALALAEIARCSPDALLGRLDLNAKVAAAELPLHSGKEGEPDSRSQAAFARVDYTVLNLPAGWTLNRVVIDDLELPEAASKNPNLFLALKTKLRDQSAVSVLLTVTDDKQHEHTKAFNIPIQQDAKIASDVPAELTDLHARPKAASRFDQEIARRVLKTGVQALADVVQDQINQLSKTTAPLVQKRKITAQVIVDLKDLGSRLEELKNCPKNAEAEADFVQRSGLYRGQLAQLRLQLVPSLNADSKDDHLFKINTPANKIEVQVITDGTVKRTQAIPITGGEIPEFRLVPEDGLHPKIQVRVMDLADSGGEQNSVLAPSFDVVYQAPAAAITARIISVAVDDKKLTIVKGMPVPTLKEGQKVETFSADIQGIPADQRVDCSWELLNAQGENLLGTSPHRYTSADSAVEVTKPIPAGNYTVRLTITPENGTPVVHQVPMMVAVAPVRKEIDSHIAFVVGISYYNAGTFSSLPTPAKNAEHFTKKLIDVYQYPPENIVTIVGTSMKDSDGKDVPIVIIEAPGLGKGKYGSPEEDALLFKGAKEDRPGRWIVPGMVTRQLLADCFARFTTMATVLKAQHTVLFYSGHGAKKYDPGGDRAKPGVLTDKYKLDHSTSCFIAGDGTPYNNGIWSDTLGYESKRLKLNTQITAFYDCCRNNSDDPGRDTMADVAQTDQNYFPIPGCSEGETALGEDTNDKEHSLFSAVLLHNMVGPVTMGDLHKKLTKEVAERMVHQNIPEFKLDPNDKRGTMSAF